MFHEFAPNLVNVHFPTQDQSFGTIYLPVDISAEPDITRFENILKTQSYGLLDVCEQAQVKYGQDGTAVGRNKMQHVNVE